MKNRWIALLLAAAVVCLPAWLALKLTGADAPAETAGQPVLVTAMARAGAMEETALSAAEPLAAALEQLRARSFLQTDGKSIPTFSHIITKFQFIQPKNVSNVV